MINRPFFTLAVSVLTLLVANADPKGSLTSDLITQLQDGYQLTGSDLARHNAVTNNAINDLALNRQIVAGEDGHFSHKIKTKGITNQKSSGRCWMFAGFNVMRPQIIEKYKLESFEFSTSYLQFWDKMEKSNLYLEDIIELRNTHRLDREWLLVNKWMGGDGGWWNYVTGLIEKYGVVPASAMPETHSSENTRTMNEVLNRLLLTKAANLLEASRNGANESELRTQKEESLKEVFRFLVINLGEPPREFKWRFRTKPKNSDSDAEELTVAKTYTPQSFYDQFVGVKLEDFVCLYHDPSQKMQAHFRFERARNIVGKAEMNFANIEIEEIKTIAVKSLLANEPLWFAANVSVDQSSEHGLMECNLFDYESLFEINLDLSKADRSYFAAGASNHAMVLTGVDLKEDKPIKWLVENSWGDDKGNKGTWTLYDRWFDEHVYTIIVNKKYVPEKTLDLFSQDAETLPAWYPGASGIDQ